MNKSILVVDDDDATCTLIKDLFTKKGYYVGIARNGKQALEILKESKFALIILDIMMPEIDGLTLLDEIKRGETHIDAPVLMLTVRNELATKIKSFVIGAREFMSKPFQIDELINKVELLLYQRERDELAQKEIDKIDPRD